MVDNKTDQILLYSDNTLFRNKAANLGESQAAQPNCSETLLLNACLSKTPLQKRYKPFL